MPDYIPTKETARIRWLWNLMAWLARDGAVNGLSHGFTIEEICEFYFAVLQAKLAADNSMAQQAAVHAALVTKKTAIHTAIVEARDFAQRLQNDPNTTDADRAAAGITIRDTTGTPEALDSILTIPAPLIKLNFSVRRQVSVHWGPNPGDERHNGRPAGTIGCEVQFAIGGIPADESLWIPFDVDTQSPLIHVIDETTPTTYAYRARYVSKRLKHGPFSDPAVCTVSV